MEGGGLALEAVGGLSGGEAPRQAGILRLGRGLKKERQRGA